MQGNEWLVCPVNGGEVRFDGSAYRGNLDCPTTRSVCCTHLNGCNNRGECRNGACVCSPGWTGAACDSAIPAPSSRAPSRATWSVSLALDEEVLVDGPRGDDNAPNELEPQLDDLPEGFGAAQNVKSVDEEEKSNSVLDDSQSSATLIIAMTLVAFVLVLILVGVVVWLFFANSSPLKARTQSV